MITFKLPLTSRYIPTDTTFTATFGTPTAGFYDFGTAANTNVSLVQLQPRSVYFLDHFQVSGNIASEDFLSVISTQPTLLFKKKLSAETMFTDKIPISVFTPQVYVCNFFRSAKDGEYLTGSFAGVLTQNTNLIGVAAVKINIKLALYAMDEMTFNKAFAGREFQQWR